MSQNLLSIAIIFNHISQVVHCCTLSLCWDWVQGGNPLYAAVKCLSVSRGQIWQIFFIFFAKSTWHIHFLTSLFFGRAQIFFPPQNWPFFLGTTTFPKLRGFCQNWGAGLWEDLGDLAWSSILLAVDRGGFCQNWGALAKIEGLGSPSMLENGPTPNKNGQLGGQKHLKNAPIFFTACQHMQNLHFAKKMV